MQLLSDYDYRIYILSKLNAGFLNCSTVVDKMSTGPCHQQNLGMIPKAVSYTFRMLTASNV